MSKTKSLSSIFAFLFLCLFMAVFTACGENPSDDAIQSIYIKDGTYATAVVKDSNYDTSNIEVYAKYVKKADAKLDGEFTFSQINTSTLGETDLSASITVDGKLFTTPVVKVKVYGNLKSLDLRADSFKSKILEDELDTYDTSHIVAVASYEYIATEDYQIDVATSSLTINFKKDEQKFDPDGKEYRELVVSYSGVSTTAKVYVFENKIVNIVSVSNFPTEIKANTEIDFSRVVVTGERADGEMIVLTKDKDDVDGYIVTGLGISSPGEQRVVFESIQDGSVYSEQIIKVFGDVLSLEIDEETVVKQVNLNSSYSTANVKVVATYEGNDLDGDPLTKILLKSSEPNLEFSDIDTSTVGEKNLTATLGNVTSDPVVVRVVSDVRVSAMYQDTNYSDFETNKTNQNTFDKTGSNGHKGFMVTENAKYYVGTDNSYFYLPIVSGYDRSTGRTTQTTQFVATVKVEQKVGENFVDVTNDQTLVSFNNYTHEFQFTKAAEDNEFRITISSGSFSASAQVFVTNGYNIQNAAQLSVFDNVNSGGKWTNFKTEHGLLNVSANKLILHKNLTLTTSDIPASHIWGDEGKPGTKGHLKNWDIGYGHNASDLNDNSDEAKFGIIYRRAVNEDETFVFEGNYFNIDISLKYNEQTGDYIHGLPLMVSEDTSPVPQQGADPILGLSSLFGCEAMVQRIPDPAYPTDTTKALDTTAKCVIQNTAFFGNSQKSEDTSFSGGLIGFKNRNIISEFVNDFSQSFYITYMIRGMDENVDLTQDEADLVTMAKFKNVAAFDNYNTLLYFQSTGKVEIEDSIMIGCGGPVMICDHGKSNQSYAGMENKGRPIFVYEKGSTLESYVYGGEPWFGSFGRDAENPGAPSMAQMLALTIVTMAQLYSAPVTGAADSYTYLKEIEGHQCLNLIALFKDDTTSLGSSAVRGKFYYDYDENAETHPCLDASTQSKIQGILGRVGPALASYFDIATPEGKAKVKELVIANQRKPIKEAYLDQVKATKKQELIDGGKTEEQAEQEAKEYIETEGVQNAAKAFAAEQLTEEMLEAAGAFTDESLTAAAQQFILFIAQTMGTLDAGELKSFLTQTQNGSLAMLGANDWIRDFTLDYVYEDVVLSIPHIDLTPNMDNIPEDENGESHLNAFIYNGMAVLLGGFHKITN